MNPNRIDTITMAERVRANVESGLDHETAVSRAYAADKAAREASVPVATPHTPAEAKRFHSRVAKAQERPLLTANQYKQHVDRLMSQGLSREDALGRVYLAATAGAVPADVDDLGGDANRATVPPLSSVDVRQNGRVRVRVLDDQKIEITMPPLSTDDRARLEAMLADFFAQNGRTYGSIPR